MVEKSSGRDKDNLPMGEVQRPPSVTSTWINWIALLSLFVAVLGLRYFEISDQITQILTVMASVALPVIVLEAFYFKRYRRLSYRRDPFDARYRRVAVKLLGLATAIAMLVFTYWLFPYFSEGDSHNVYALFERIWLPLACVTPIYFWFVDGLMEDPEDEYYAAGLYILGLLPKSDYHKLAKHIRASFVKIFFYQFMLTAALWHLNNLVTVDVVDAIEVERFGFLTLVIDSLFLIDLAFAATGYFLTLRLFDSHIRTAEPTVLGWLVCLVCYSIFYDMFYEGFVAYNDGLYWGQWLRESPLLKALWAIPVVGLLTIYSLATVQFGIRFSNLTHRGIITNGPYRFSKHPAYLAKNAFWWFVSIPFISMDGGEVAIKHCLMLATINVVYYYRAKTEERHLSLDPVYREYAAWIAQHGLIARLKRLMGLELQPYKVPLRPIVGEPNPYERPAAGE